jgi:hypothetical protein
MESNVSMANRAPTDDQEAGQRSTTAWQETFPSKETYLSQWADPLISLWLVLVIPHAGSPAPGASTGATTWAT